jgi:hypothetical protein
VTSSTHPYGTVAFFVERFRNQHTPAQLNNALIGAVEGAAQFSADDTTAVQCIRHALAATSIVRGEQQDLAWAEQFEVAEPSPLQAPEAGR